MVAVLNHYWRLTIVWPPMIETKSPGVTIMNVDRDFDYFFILTSDF
jgi:hypothetical protein